MKASIARPLSGEYNKKLNNKVPTHSESTSAILNVQVEMPESKVGLPGEEAVENAKDWVDNGSRL
ncbi:hypothetical protein CS063_00510 [Sporanaerobium hydrogeniformans]|uniref:Uncharacterized protein n=1 Tax=Sporanaerobium hydrogeniformans TaxID=3072179 RepID=A0AC61DHB9_9FIRM|nr:DUF3787 domain-containing protein [Sporanaerobium hydrogeniformans]PHV71991.1 hypothetical protein CS063_00510 [Sporanaerobium hydrogeniformans]